MKYSMRRLSCLCTTMKFSNVWTALNRLQFILYQHNAYFSRVNIFVRNIWYVRRTSFLWNMKYETRRISIHKWFTHLIFFFPTKNFQTFLVSLLCSLVWRPCMFVCLEQHVSCTAGEYVSTKLQLLAVKCRRIIMCLKNLTFWCRHYC